MQREGGGGSLGEDQDPTTISTRTDQANLKKRRGEERGGRGRGKEKWEHAKDRLPSSADRSCSRRSTRWDEPDLERVKEVEQTLRRGRGSGRDSDFTRPRQGEGGSEAIPDPISGRGRRSRRLGLASTTSVSFLRVQDRLSRTLDGFGFQEFLRVGKVGEESEEEALTSDEESHEEDDDECDPDSSRGSMSGRRKGSVSEDEVVVPPAKERRSPAATGLDRQEEGEVEGEEANMGGPLDRRSQVALTLPTQPNSTNRDGSVNTMSGNEGCQDTSTSPTTSRPVKDGNLSASHPNMTIPGTDGSRGGESSPPSAARSRIEEQEPPLLEDRRGGFQSSSAPSVPNSNLHHPRTSRDLPL
ncbi:hypothetical protein IE53DRAFT_413426 [Violaceomyces palustris]|uniref:Uncharacterized protein n=1 Tax=Violaceomyces palustris TaxID=1673888 RepID=A0ACD0NM44_9BASI|nr:hypothetical protein IE53DRAFT_413426 [Violaceomyces palustris]